jgi:hypothetical protein
MKVAGFFAVPAKPMFLQALWQIPRRLKMTGRAAI